MEIARHKVRVGWYRDKTFPAVCGDAGTIVGSWGVPLLHFLVPQVKKKVASVLN
jgi:hypothetical protein